jgi:hypothetical protein
MIFESLFKAPPKSAFAIFYVSISICLLDAAVIGPTQPTIKHSRSLAFLQLDATPALQSFRVKDLYQPTDATFTAGECPTEHVDLPAWMYEFGWEINIAVPHAYFLFKCGKLSSTKSCNSNLSAYYWFSPKHTVVNCQLAGFQYGDYFDGIGCTEYLNNEHLPQWYPPPHAAFYRQKVGNWPGARRTGILLLNKNNHGGSQSNGGFINGITLSRVMAAMRQQCPETEVLYYRDWQFQEHDLAWERETDNSQLNASLEAEALSQNPNAHAVRDLPSFSADSREAQMLTWSRFTCFLTVHGGNTDLASNFGGRMLVYIRGIDWYDVPATQARLSGLAKTSMQRVRSDDELLQSLPFLTKDHCRQCAMHAMSGSA